MGENIVETILNLVQTQLERQRARDQGVTLAKDTSFEEALASLSPESREKMRSTVDLSGDGRLGPIEYTIAFTESMKRQFRELNEQAKVKGSPGWQQLEDLKNATQQDPHRITAKQFLSVYTEMGEKLFEGNYVPMNIEWAAKQANQYNEAIFIRANGVTVPNPFEKERQLAARDASAANISVVPDHDSPIGYRVPSAAELAQSNTPPQR